MDIVMMCYAMLSINLIAAKEQTLSEEGEVRNIGSRQLTCRTDSSSAFRAQRC